MPPNWRAVLPPHDEELEGLLLYAVMTKPDLLDRIDSPPEPADFYLPNHRLLWRAVTAIVEAGLAPTEETIREYLPHDCQAYQDPNFLLMLNVNYRDVNHDQAPDMVRALRHFSMKRRLLAYAQQVAALTTSANGNLMAAVEEAHETLLRGIEPDDRHIVTFQQAASRLYDELCAVREGRTDPRITTGITDLDAKLGGLIRNRVSIWAGRPGSGKSAMCLQLALAAEASGHRVGIISLEMVATELAQRAFAMKHGIPTNRHYNMDDAEWAIFTRWRHETDKAIWFDEADIQNPAHIASTCRARKRREGLDVVMLDYLQLVDTADDRNKRRVEQIGDITRAMARLAKQLNIHIMIACQMNRAIEKENRLPRLDDLRESGRIEEDAYQVVFLHHETPVDELGSDPEPVKAVIAKNRGGPPGVVDLLFLPERTLFAQVARGVNLENV